MDGKSAHYLIFVIMISGCDSESAAKIDKLTRIVTQAPGTFNHDVSFTPPKNGILTEAQIKMYISVKKHSRQLAGDAAPASNSSPTQASGSKQREEILAKLKVKRNKNESHDNLDLLAVKQLKFNAKEYMWIQDTIRLTKDQMLLKSFNSKNKLMISEMENALERLKQRRNRRDSGAQNTHLERQIQDMQTQIVQFKKEIATEATLSDATKRNANIINAYLDELQTLENP